MKVKHFLVSHIILRNAEDLNARVTFIYSDSTVTALVILKVNCAAGSVIPDTQLSFLPCFAIYVLTFGKS